MQFSILKDKKHIDRLFVVLFLSVLSICIFKDSVIFGDNFGWYNDQVFQYNIFYEEWYKIIKETLNNGVISPYSWNLFLGTDFYVSKLFTVTGDIFALFAFVFFEISNMSRFLSIETVICISLSGLFMLMLLDELDVKNRSLKISLSILYALSGFIVVFVGTYMFHRFYAFMPLIFMYTERYIKNKKSYGFIFVVAILFLQNYELMFSLSLYLILYFIMSYKLKYCEDSIFQIIKKAFRLIVYYLVGILMVGFALVPLLLFIKSSTRVGNFEYGELFWGFDVLVGFISNLFFPPFNIRNYEPFYLFKTLEYYGFEYSFYTTPLLILAFILFNKKASKKEKKIIYTSELILLLFLFLRPLNMVVHGFSVPTFRWSLVLIIHHIFLMAYIFEKYDYDKHNYKLISIIVLFFLTIFFINLFRNDCEIANMLPSVAICLALVFLLYVYDYLTVKNLKYGLYFAVTMTIVLFGISSFNNLKIKYDQGEAFNREYLEYFMSNDEDKMFRYYFDSDELRPFNFLNLNNSLEYNYMTTTTYDSAYEYVLNDFLDKNGIFNWIIDINDPELLRMLGVKYVAYVENDDVVSKLDAEYVYNLNEYAIYKIKDYNSVGHTYTNFIKASDAENHKINWNSELIVEDKVYDELSEINASDKCQLKVLEYNRQFMKAQIDVSSKQVLMISIPYSEGWNIYDQNGVKLDQMLVQGGFLGLLIDENIKEINMYYATPGLKLGLVISCLGAMSFVAVVFIESYMLKKKSSK